MVRVANGRPLPAFLWRLMTVLCALSDHVFVAAPYDDRGGDPYNVRPT